MSDNKGNKSAAGKAESKQKGGFQKGAHKSAASRPQDRGGRRGNGSAVAASGRGNSIREPLAQNLKSGHPVPDSKDDRGFGGARGITAPNIVEFCKSLSRSITNYDAVVRVIRSAHDLWNQAFDAVAESADMAQFISVLLKVIVILPDQRVVSLPPERILPLLIKLTHHARDVSSLRLFLDVFPKLYNESCLRKMRRKEDVLFLANKLVDEIDNTAKRLMSSLAVRDVFPLIAEMSNCVSSFQVFIQTYQVRCEEHKGDEDIPVYMRWSASPTLKWLLDARWLQHEPLREQYESVEQYAATMKSLWTTLSFYWGAAALSPRCHHSESGQACLNPLLSNPRNNKFCTMRLNGPQGKMSCGKPALHGCFRFGHDTICASCFTKKQELIVGPPAQRDSSTDIYDAVVNTLSVRNDSTVLGLRSTMSRKPPEASINWPTTYRLQPTSLVALVNLAVSKASLKPEQHIYFGEIISSHNNDREEYARRERGELSVRLLTKQDCIFLTTPSPSFNKGSNVAIIDLRVFVPEVVSVLATLCSPSFDSSLQRLPYVNKLLGVLDVAKAGDHIEFASSSLEQQVAFSVFHSDIQCIRRFSEADKQLLVQRISSIPNIRSMDTTQREALCAALQSSVHCTQGPPGTGKSYTGVALVLALMQVREIVRKNGGSTGPIIMLSYKNHALDEFLVDVLKSNGDLNGNRSMLIRLGNPENFALKGFTEKRSSAESEAQRRLEGALQVVKTSLAKARELYLGYSSVSASTFVKLIGLCLRHQNESIADITADEAYKLLTMILDAFNVTHSQLNTVPLVSSASHWEKTLNDIYQLWMDGSTPPPRCMKRDAISGQIVQCMGCAVPGSSFCQRHCCQVENCCEEKSNNTFFCSGHKCKAQECENVKLIPSHFCPTHSCMYCLDKCARSDLSTCVEHTCQVYLCNRPQLFPLQVCHEHKCMLCPSVVNDSYIRDMQWGFCDVHKCEQEHCQLSRAFNLEDKVMTRYCENHTCFKCIELGGNLNSETMTHRYTCAEHVLCEYCSELGEECSSLVMGKDEFYCFEHAAMVNNDDVICHGITKKGKSCKTRKPPSEPFQHPWYCHDHMSQKPSKKVEVVGKKTHGVSLINMLAQCEAKLPSPQTCAYGECSVKTCHGDNWMCPFHAELWLSEQKRNMLVGEEVADGNVSNSAADSIILGAVETLLPLNHRNHDAAVPHSKEEDVDYGFASDEDEAAAQEKDLQVSNNPDEMDSKFINHEPVNSVEEEGGDIDFERNQERHELYESESDSDIESNSADWKDGDRKALPDDILKQLFSRAYNWSWKMNRECRLDEVDSFLNSLAGLLEFLVRRSDAYVDILRKERAEASSAVLKQATLIGGTVVGAAKRLMALRAAEPFAVIVEEACEVMEPTLIAVLAVNSVQKMELIGDHRQLPAFINHNWYNFEITVPRIKKSLFERLIDCSEKSHGSESVCTVLDVQRRMRSYISDITRPHYVDKVAIQDHEKTATQRIGDRLEKDSKRDFLRVFISNWYHKGMHVPGISSDVFFWNLNNNGESRPVAGLSACNETEAFAVASLTRYLQFCGVPDSSITIITPYQGQRRLLIKVLRKVGCMPKPEYSNSSLVNTSQLTVSTVDRYQGDENDIVILSLVRTKPGNRFVSLVNRFIVASSRARIGFYIVGSVSAISHEGKDANRQDLGHWDSFLELLGNSSDGAESRIGDSFPLCCSVHSEIRGKVPSSNVASMTFPCASEDWKRFCCVPCTTKLACGHECGLTCHMFSPKEHNKRCMVTMPRDCAVHNQLAPCHEITSAKNWKCEIVDNYSSPYCAHSANLKCCDYKLIETGYRDWPKCTVSVPDYFHPSCNHVFSNLVCDMRRKYEDAQPNCERKVTISRSCGHKVEVKCFQRFNPLSPCMVAVNGKKPRCGHQISMPCHDYERLHNLYDAHKGCEPAFCPRRNQVMLDQADSDLYGPEEKELPGYAKLPGCTVPTLIRRTCSHVVEAPCSAAFAFVKRNALPPCDQSVEIKCAFCQETLLIPCCKKDEYDRFYNMLDFRSILSENTLLGLKEELQPISELLLSCKCAKNVKLIRVCAHDLGIPCIELVKFILGKRTLPICKANITQQREECGHAVDRKCHQRNEPLAGKCSAIVNAAFTFPTCGHELSVKECYDWQRLRNDPVPKCLAIVSTNHIRCGHEVNVCCNIMPLCRFCDDTYSDLCLPDTENVVDVQQRYCQPLPDTPECSSNVDVKLSCGHVKQNVPCSEAFSWTVGAEGEEPPCTEVIDLRSPLCCHDLPLLCRDKEALAAWDPWGGVKIQKETITLTEKANQFVYTLPLVVEPQVPAAVTKILPKCTKPVGVIFQDCKHVVEKPCCDLFFSSSPLVCQEQVPVECLNPLCRQVRIIPCGKLKLMSADEIARDCPFKVSKTCGLCMINKVTVPCGQILVECKQMVNVTLPCGHTVEWLCAEGVTHPSVYHDTDSGYNRKCSSCAYKAWELWRSIDIEEEQLREVARGKLLSVIKDSSIVREETIVINIDQHEKARVLNIGKLQTRLQSDCKIYAEDSDIPWPNVESSEDIVGFISNHFDLVFLPIFKEKVDHAFIKDKRLAKGITGCGYGVQISSLTEQTLQNLFLGSEVPTKRLCVCLAFNCNRLTSLINPFMPLHLANNIRDLERSKWTKAQKDRFSQMNEQTMFYQRKGYDCVQVYEDEVPTTMTVYWHPHAIVPLSIQEIEIQNSCLICLERKPKNSKQGAICRQGHFVCWETCFIDYLTEACSADSQASFVNSQGHLCCPQCKEGYDIIKLGSLAPRDLGDQLVNLKCQSTSNKEVKKALEQERKRFEEEQKKIKAMNARDQELYFLRKEICEEILTNRCPRCRRAFVDFDGCFALTCSGQGGCGCHFCAWCLKAEGGDMHGHVVRCPLGNSNVFGNRQALDEVWNNQRRNKINVLLQNRSPEIRREILKRMEKDFADIGLVI